jgi:signal transduction histidine kinase
MKNKDEHLSRHIRAIDQATITASTLVQRLRSLSRKGRSRNQPLHMNEIIQKIMEQQEHRIPARVRVDLDLDPGLPEMLANGMHLEQILLNLLDNALDVLGDQGDIRMATSLYQSSGDDEVHPDLDSGWYVQFTFADNGPGMDPDVQARVFEPFFTTHREGQKAGLGMSIVRALVRAHGGHVYCRSAPGQGTRFILFFPVTPKTHIPTPSLR